MPTATAIAAGTAPRANPALRSARITASTSTPGAPEPTVSNTSAWVTGPVTLLTIPATTTAITAVTKSYASSSPMKARARYRNSNTSTRRAPHLSPSAPIGMSPISEANPASDSMNPAVQLASPIPWVRYSADMAR